MSVYSLSRRLATKSLKKYGATWEIGQEQPSMGSEERPGAPQIVYRPISALREDKRRMSPGGLMSSLRVTLVVEAGIGAKIGDKVKSPDGHVYTVDDIGETKPGSMELMSRLWLA